MFGHGVTHARITPDTTRIVPSGDVSHPGYGVYIIYAPTIDNAFLLSMLLRTVGRRRYMYMYQALISPGNDPLQPVVVAPSPLCAFMALHWPAV